MSDPVAEQKRYYAERAPEYDDWWYRRGRYELEPEALGRWQADIAEAEAALEEFAPIVGAPIALPVPGVSLAATTSAIPSAKRGGVGAALYVATLLVAGAIGLCIVRGDLTRDDARGAAAAVARAASHVVDSVKRL